MMIYNTGHHKPVKSLGQNFLIDATVIQQILTTIQLQPTQIVIEIGAGLGAITQYMVQYCSKVLAIEIDRNLCVKLDQLLRSAIDNHQLQIISQDVLQINFWELFDDLSLKPRIVGNIPYNISTPLLFKLLSYRSNMIDLHLLLQKEVAERLVALPHSKQYGRLSIMAQYHASIINLFPVNATSFQPQPKVESCFIKIIPHAELPYKANNYNHFSSLVRDAFCQRRKILPNALKQYCSPMDLKTLGLDLNFRPEDLGVADFVNISNACTKE